LIRPVRKSDAAALTRIYNHYVETTTVTFATEPVSEDDMYEDICGVSNTLPWLVWETDGKVVGYAMASAWKSRCAYRYSAEPTIYLAPDAGGAGIGTQLYGALLDMVKAAGHHSALGGIALPNDPSVRLHEKLGFEKVGHLKEVGRKFDEWVDVGYWQKVFGG
jgi:phosphinothricin acetyltransferase